MMSLLSISIVMVGLIVIFYEISWLFSESSWEEGENSGPFECGFKSCWNTQSTFSIQFYSIILVFLVFDMEVIMLLPSQINTENTTLKMFILSYFMFLLMGGLVYEWVYGSLEWVL